MYVKIPFILLFWMGLALSLFSNNIQVNSVIVLPVKNALFDRHSMIQFNISGENSWRASYTANWDAAWIFAKYRKNGGEWRHAKLHNIGHDLGSYSSAITLKTGLLDEKSAFDSVSNPVLGVFMYRTYENYGSYSLSQVKLRWNWDEDMTSHDLIEVRVFAIEMVYVPLGAFHVGDGATTNIRGRFRDASANVPMQISSEGALTLGGSVSGNLASSDTANMETADDFGQFTTQTLPATFPKGYAGFYCMKYEISQKQYADFLNTIPSAQASIRTSSNFSFSGGTYITNKPHVANHLMSWADGICYAMWAGLRPMTELEFEKACRGNQTPVVGEYAWGTAGISSGQYTLSNQGAYNETVTGNYSTVESLGNVNYNSTVPGGNHGPFRCGIFATSTSNRVQAGASYYGIMELSGNLWERAISVGHASGRAFTGSHGDGSLSRPSDWPDENGAGICFRGGDWNGGWMNLGVSDRYYGAFANTVRGQVAGFRAVRSLPQN